RTELVSPQDKHSAARVRLDYRATWQTVRIARPNRHHSDAWIDRIEKCRSAAGPGTMMASLQQIGAQSGVAPPLPHPLFLRNLGVTRQKKAHRSVFDHDHGRRVIGVVLREGPRGVWRKDAEAHSVNAHFVSRMYASPLDSISLGGGER